jgi:hypothetical protein
MPTLKQALYCLDSDQTYDLLWANNLLDQHSNYLKQHLGYRLLFPSNVSEFPLSLIERYTPYKEPWCELWTTVVFDFFRALSKFKTLKNPLLSGQRWGLASPQWLENLIPPNLPIFPQTIKVKIPRGKVGSVTWLGYAHDPIGAVNIHPNIPQKINIINQYRVLLGGMDGDRVVEIPTNGMLINSVVITDGELVTDSPLILFDQFENTLTEILDSLKIETPEYLSEFSIRSICKLTFGKMFYTSQGGDSIQTAQFEQPTLNTHVENTPPDWYWFASLHYANNNPWGTVTALTDLGYPITPVFDENNLYFELWYVGEKIPPSTSSQLINFLQPPHFAQHDFYYPIIPPSNNVGFEYRLELTGGSNLAYGNVRYKFATQWLTELVDKTVYTFSRDWGRIANITQEIREPSQVYQWGCTSNFLSLGFNWQDLDPRLIKDFQAFIWHPRYVKGVLRLYSPITEYTEITSINLSIENLSIKSSYSFVPQNEGIICFENLEIFDNSSVPLNFDDQQSGFFYGYSVDYWESNEQYEFNFLLTSQPGSLIPIFPHTNQDIINIINVLNFENVDREVYPMPDSVRLKEVHAALNAGNFSKDPTNSSVFRFANLGYYIERIARVLGISVNPDGSIRAVRQRALKKPGEEIPAGWPIGQWGRNQGGNEAGQIGGNPEHDKDGINYPLISNTFSADPFSGEATNISESGYALCENLIQYLETFKDDLDKALGLQEAAANILPLPESKKSLVYEGLGSLVSENSYMLSELSRSVVSSHISSLICQGILIELLAQQGVPTTVKELIVKIGDKDQKIPYPAISPNSPSNFDQTLLVLMNLSPLLGGKLTIREDKKEKEVN